MPSAKQIQSRLQIKKNSLNKVNSNIAQAGTKNKIILRRLNQEKDSLGRDIRKLERQLITMEKESAKRDMYS